MNRIAGALIRFNRASRHWEARHPALCGAACGLIFPAIWAAFGQLPWYPLATPAFIVVYVSLMAAWQRYLWRPGGMKRKSYERWVARQEQIDTEDDEPFRAGWYLDPSHRYDRRYWDGIAWTAWVADGGDAFVDDGAPLDRAVIAASVVTSIAVGWRTPLRVSEQDARTLIPPVQPKRETFRRSFGATAAVAVVTAWPTWIRGWPALLPLIILAGLVGIAVVGAVLAVKVARIERRDRSTLCSRGVRRALRGTFIETTAT
jgi:hypothetical protein